MPHSHHSHSGQFCRHAAGRLEEVVLEAIRQGFEVYGLSEHVPRYREQDLYPEEAGLPLNVLARQFDDFLDEAEHLRALYASRITLLVGLETEFITATDLDELEGLLGRHRGRIDYLVGSVHHVNGVPIDLDLPTFHVALSTVQNSGDNPQATENIVLKSSESPRPSQGSDEDSQLLQGYFLSAYLDAQYELLRRFRPEVVGHIDLCRLYTPAIRFSDFPGVLDRLERNIRFAISYGALFEANSAAFRKGWDTAYPGEDVLQLILGLGGRFALSDDSHGPHAVGLNYTQLAAYLRRAGVVQLWYLQQSSKPNAAGRFVCPLLVEGSWWDHPFWVRYKEEQPCLSTTQS